MLTSPAATNSICVYFAEPSTLRVSVTKVTFKDLFIFTVIAHGAEGADRYAGTTADADVIINFNVLKIFVAGDCLYRAPHLSTGHLRIADTTWECKGLHAPTSLLWIRLRMGLETPSWNTAQTNSHNRQPVHFW